MFCRLLRCRTAAMRILRTKRSAVLWPLCGVAILWMLVSTTNTLNTFSSLTNVDRRLSIDLGGGQCVWTEAVPAGRNADVYGTLLAGYPGSGMRVVWRHTEGVSGIQVGDDFKIGGKGLVDDKTGLIKTQYPHFEGKGDWGSDMDQVVLVVRNPRWAIPSYHSFLWEMNYAQDWDEAYTHLFSVFQNQPPVADWVQWRDHRFEEEVQLWTWFIDFYMEGGTQYWMDLDYERNGQRPFRYLTEAERHSKEKDPHCHYELDCVPAKVVMYEKLLNAGTGPDELAKIAEVLRNKNGMERVVGQEAISCVYNETWARAQLPFNNTRDEAGPHAAYEFTVEQLGTILAALQAVIDKYSKGDWAADARALALVDALVTYRGDVADERDALRATAPTPMMLTAAYRATLANWYESIGRGSRYTKAKAQAMDSYWPLVKHLYE